MIKFKRWFTVLLRCIVVLPWFVVGTFVGMAIIAVREGIEWGKEDFYTK